MRAKKRSIPSSTAAPGGQTARRDKLARRITSASSRRSAIVAEPAIADIDRCIETIEKSEKRWSGNAQYRKFLETELFCLREVRARLVVVQGE
ncbi:hypothetical protein [Bradyrhizobium stylosanthis]|uniref:hypothetical protein n=1 Tax=Bradyrhizobium stylosanthis TaxID=1803665 RepID=UPI0011A732A1|nr:hypothetical protein [Bradyrhizobium stylosanthis]